MTQTAHTPRTWALMGVLALIWGASFLSNRVALEEVGTFTIVAFRVAGAASLMWVWVLARGLTLPRGARIAASFLLMGLIGNALPFSLIVWGQNHVPSGLAAILNAATAILGVAVAALVFADEKMTLRKGLGVALGFAGVTTAIGLANLRALDLTSMGQLAIIGSSLSYAFTGAFARVAMRGVSPLVASAGMLTGGSVIMLPLAYLTEGTPTFDYAPQTWAALAYLAFVASALAYLVYYTVLAEAGAGNTGLVTLMVAPVAIVLGAVVYGEELALRAYAGFVLLAAGLLVIDGRVLRALKATFARQPPARRRILRETPPRDR